MGNQEFTFNDNGKTSNVMFIREIFELLLRNWYWFILSVILCVAISLYRYMEQPLGYTKTATILIKDNSSGSGVTPMTAFSEIDMFKGYTSIDNEMYVIKSKRLMGAVIDKLNLDVTYSSMPKLRPIDLYKYSPVVVSFVNKNSGYFNFSIIPMSDKEYKIEYGEKESVHIFEDTISIAPVKFVVDKSMNFNSNALNNKIIVNLMPHKAATNIYRDKLSAYKTNQHTSLVTLSVSDTNPLKAEEIINTLIEVYNRDAIDDKNKIAQSTELFIIDRLTKIGGELGGVDGEIEQFKRDNKITDLNTASSMYMQNSSEYRNEGIAIETQMTLVKFIKEYLQNPSKATELIPSNTGIADLGIENQISSYNEAKLRLNKLLESSGENNPAVKELESTLSTTKASMISAIDNLISSLEIKLENTKTQENIANRRIASAPTQEKEVVNILREQKIKEELYLYLLNKREENALNLAITDANARIVDSADGSDFPNTPILYNFLIIGLIVGLGIPGAVIFIINILDSRVRGRSDIESMTTIPIIGDLPQKPKHQKNETISVKENSHDRISEAFQVLRSNLDFFAPKEHDGATVIMLTSTLSGEGKTFIATNLALAFAFTDKKVLLIDMDLRKGTLTKNIGKNHAKGISNWLLGKCETIDEIISCRELHPNMDIIHAGSIPPNPSKLLLSNRFDDIIDTLREKYDYIFIDSVPAKIVADANIINRVVDITIYVVRDRKLDRRYLPELEKINKENRFKNLSIILCDVDITKGGYGYGYGYGYANEDKKSKFRKKKSQ